MPITVWAALAAVIAIDRDAQLCVRQYHETHWDKLVLATGSCCSCRRSAAICRVVLLPHLGDLNIAAHAAGSRRGGNWLGLEGTPSSG
ncbi:MAG: hypothetical protein ACLR9W_03825 [Enterobacter hormaechei]